MPGTRLWGCPLRRLGVVWVAAAALAGAGCEHSCSSCVAEVRPSSALTFKNGVVTQVGAGATEWSTVYAGDEAYAAAPAAVEGEGVEASVLRFIVEGQPGDRQRFEGTSWGDVTVSVGEVYLSALGHTCKRAMLQGDEDYPISITAVQENTLWRFGPDVRMHD